jgi:hypothetical protein
MKLLPDEYIDYTKYSGTSGMSTKHFGPCLWDFLFISILGSYPIKIDTSNQEHIQLQESYRVTLLALQNTLPCIFCRDSLKVFIKELPVEPYLIGRFELMYWLYLIKDKVNQKLLCQEAKFYKKKTKIYTKLYKRKEYTDEMYHKKMDKLEKCFETTPTPDFKDVLDKYERFRATCNPDKKKCEITKIK